MNKRILMGRVSNLITTMVINGESEEDIKTAIRLSMAVIKLPNDTES